MEHCTTLLAGLRSAHGTRPGARIWTTNVQLHQQNGDLTLLSYQEWQVIAGVQTRRQSSVLFGARASAPNGIEWLHLHETWLRLM